MLTKLALGLILGSACLSTLAQSVSEIHTTSESSAYTQDARGAVMRSGSGLCWRTGYWTPDDAVAGCDGELLPPIVKPTAPDLVPPAANTAAVSPLAVEAPVSHRCDFSIALSTDDAFAFGKATLSAAAITRLKEDFRRHISACNLIESVNVNGHTDRVGDPKANMHLSEQRAEAVAKELQGIGVTAPIKTNGFGSTQPLITCSQRNGRAKFIACLAPNRRATIDVHGQGQ